MHESYVRASCLRRSGLAVAPEHRCTPYARRDYPYAQSVEAGIVAFMGGRIYGPYTGRYFASTRQTDIEHIVAVSEAHDSGLCAADRATRRRFASDPLNLTLAAPTVNRCGASGKCALDAAEWLPPMNRCWFAGRVVAVKRKYGLTVDLREAAALERVLSGCRSTEMVFATGRSMPMPAKPKMRPPASSACHRRRSPPSGHMVADMQTVDLDDWQVEFREIRGEPGLHLLA